MKKLILCFLLLSSQLLIASPSSQITNQVNPLNKLDAIYKEQNENFIKYNNTKEHSLLQIFELVFLMQQRNVLILNELKLKATRGY